MKPSDRGSAVVVGAGSAGLAAAAMLRRAGLATLVLEKGPSVATAWRTRYDSLRLNTLRWLSSLPGLRMPRSYGRWVARDDFVTYLEDYAAHHRLDVRFGVEVERLDAADGGWVVRMAGTSVRADVVVLATGVDAVPHLPPWPGLADTSIPVVHSAGYRSPEPYRNRRVLVVGAGNSGTEIAVDLVAGGAKDVLVSVRSAPAIVPAELHGIPLHPLGVLVRHLPLERLDRGTIRTQLRAFGDLTAHGLGLPDYGPVTRYLEKGQAPVSDRGFVAQVKAGRVRVLPAVERLEAARVVLADGRTLAPDAMIAATGYRSGLARLAAPLGVLDERGAARTNARPLPGAPGLFLVGAPSPAGTLREHGLDARRVARHAVRHLRQRRRAAAARARATSGPASPSRRG